MERKPVHMHFVGGPEHGKVFDLPRFEHEVRVPVYPKPDERGHVGPMWVARYVWHPGRGVWVFHP